MLRASKPKVLAWLALACLSVIVTAGLRAVHLPGALMLGPMLAGIVVAQRIPGVSVPRRLALTAQALLGCLIAAVMTPAMLTLLLPDWPMLLGMNVALIAGIALIGMIAAKTNFIPGTSGIWGMSPGAASAMVVLCEAYGGDRRLVALMQYLRLIALAFVVIAIATLLGKVHSGPPVLAMPGAQGVPWLVPPAPQALASIAVLTVLAMLGAWLLRAPSLVIFIPVFGGIALQLAEMATPALPPLVAAAAFCVIGWNVGLGFTPEVLRQSARLLPRIALVIAAVIGFCLLLASGFAWLAGIDFLSAYLALNPGGADVVLVTAANLEVDLPLIMAMQVSRILLVMLAVPTLGKLAATLHLRGQNG